MQLPLYLFSAILKFMTNPTPEKIFLATFKGYYPIEETINMVEKLLEKVKTLKFQLHIAAPLDYIKPLVTHFSDQTISFGADVMLPADSNSFTGSVTGLCLKELNCQFTLIGSAQERAIYTPSGVSLKNKIEKTLEQQIRPILAIGESLHDFEDNLSEKILTQLLQEALEGLTKEQLNQINILYDAPWLSDSSWGDTSEYVPQAYSRFIKVTHDYLATKEASTPLLFSIPCFAEHLPKIPLDTVCGGYYLGVMTPAHTIEPLQLHPEQTTKTEEPLTPTETTLQEFAAEPNKTEEKALKEKQ